jgi:hypothetical protein
VTSVVLYLNAGDVVPWGIAFSGIVNARSIVTLR